jgi:L-lactate dehydrogenase complex protein LldG
MATDSLFESFRTRAQAVSADVHRFARKSEALDFIAGLFEPGVSAVWASGPLVEMADRARLLEAVPGLTFNVTREAAAAAAVGVTEVEWAIAATGTLAGDFAPVERRLASSLPPVHIALVRTAAIQPDMAAFFSVLNPSRSAYISFITGPSRTADIERVLTIGVHGPKRLVVVFVDEPSRTL